MSQFLVNSSPHIRSEETTRSLMTDVIIALLPALAGAVIFFGFRSLFLVLVTVASCLAAETLFNRIVKRKNTVDDRSAIITGILLAFNLPVTAPYWLAMIGAFFAIVIVKMLFGGLGRNFLNPALAARAFLFSWPGLMTSFTAPFQEIYSQLGFIFGNPVAVNGVLPEEIDAIACATPLKNLKQGLLPDASLGDLFVGNVGGCLGETSALLLLLGGVYLLLRKVITWHIPVSYLGTVAVLTVLFPRGEGSAVAYMAAELCSGGLMLGAIFMATDYTTSPVTRTGRLIYGIGCGFLTVFLRYFGGYAEAVSYSILIMNVVTLAIDRLVKPKRYGIGGGRL